MSMISFLWSILKRKNCIKLFTSELPGHKMSEGTGWDDEWDEEVSLFYVKCLSPPPPWPILTSTRHTTNTTRIGGWAWGCHSASDFTSAIFCHSCILRVSDGHGVIKSCHCFFEFIICWFGKSPPNFLLQQHNWIKLERLPERISPLPFSRVFGHCGPYRNIGGCSSLFRSLLFLILHLLLLLLEPLPEQHPYPCLPREHNGESEGAGGDGDDAKQQLC